MDNIGHHEEKISQTMKEKILDLKSRGVYDRWWSLYCGFCESKNFARERYSSFLDFVGHLAENYKYSSIWQACSCINKYLKIRCETADFLQKESFKCFMKRLGKSYVPKKSSVFTLDDVQKIIESEKANLSIKVAMIVGVFGGLRTCELINMVFEDVVLEHGVYKVLITSSQTDPGGIGHTFFISPSPNQ